MKLKGHGVEQAVTIIADFPFCRGMGIPFAFSPHKYRDVSIEEHLQLSAHIAPVGWCSNDECPCLPNFFTNFVGAVLWQDTHIVRSAFHACDAWFHFKVVEIDPLYLVFFFCTFSNRPKKGRYRSIFLGLPFKTSTFIVASPYVI